MYEVITVGSNTIDVFARTRFSELIKIMNPEGEIDLLAYPSGSKILIEELNFTTGGGGTNAAVALSRLGHKVAYLGKVGNDANSDFIVNDLKKENIGLILVRGRGCSGYSMILDSLKHDRTILTFKGCNDKLKFSEIPLKRLKAKWFYFSSMLGESFRTLEKLSSYARKNNIKIVFNPSSYLAEKGAAYLSAILRHTHILILNKCEAELLAGHGTIPSMLRKLAELGPSIVAITNGKAGVFVFDGDYFYSAKAHKIGVVETTGAGDAFAASFLSGILKKGNMEFAIKLGMTNAESVITHHGAKNKLLRYVEALNVLRRRPVRVVKRKA
jgi:ribokinase